MKKSLYCPICGFQGEDLIFAFYCMNSECQNFKDDELKQEESDNTDTVPFWGDSYWPHETD